MQNIITSAELSAIAELSKFEIESDKAGELIKDLENMIRFAEQISEAEVSDQPKETARLFSIAELRADVPAPSLSREKALTSAPTHTDIYITVPAVIEE